MKKFYEEAYVKIFYVTEDVITSSKDDFDDQYLDDIYF